MQKIIKLETENTTVERWTENSACEIYSHDTNNGHFEIEVMNEALTDETVTALFIFEESESVWRTEGTVEENKIKFKFDTTLITQDETVVCVLYLDNERENNDFYRFSFKVKISEIDKLDNLTIKERLFKNNLIIDRLEVVTKDELKEALKNLDLSSISTEGLLTEEKANGLYAKISELEAVESKLITQEQLTSTKNEVVTEINNRLENYALKTNIPEAYNDTNLVGRVTDLENKQDKDTIYDDSELKARISVLESREDNNTIYDDTNVRERLTVLENKPNIDISNLATKDELNEVRNSQPTVDTSNLVTKQELEEKHFLTTHQDLSEYALKSELPQPYNDSALVQKIGQLEARVDNDTIYNDTEVKNRLTELENKPPVDLSNYALKSELPQPYNDKQLNERVTALESKAIEGGAYDDSDLRSRVVALESKTDNDTVYNDTELRSRVTELENKPTLDTSEFVTNQALENKNYITEEILNSKGYAKTSEIPTPYNDSEVKQRLTNLESIDTSKFITDEKLESKGYLKSHQDITGLATKEELANLVTNDQLEAKHYITGAALENYALKSDIPQGYNDTEVKERLTVLENKQDKDTIYNDTELRTRVSELEQRPIATPYNDTALSDRVSALESKQDKDTIYNDSELRQRVETLENKPPIDTSKFITEEVLESKNYLTTPYNDIPLKGRIEVLENKVDKDTVYNDEPIKERLTALESKPNIDLTGYATKEELKAKVNTSDYDTFKNMVVTKGYLESKNYLTEQYNDKPLTDRVVALENKQDNDTIYDDSELKRRVTTLETRTENLVTKEELHEATEIDYSNIVTTDELEAKHYVTETELNNKGFLTQHQDISNLATKEEIKKFVTHEELPQPYNDTNLSNRVTALENKTDKDTIYNDTELRNRVSTLESRPNIEVSTLVTKDELASKGYLTTPYNDSALVSRVTALEIKQDKDTVYNDTEVKRRLTALESRPAVKNGIRKPLVIGWQDIYIQNMRFSSQMNLVDVENNVILRSINGLDIKRVNNATYGYVIFNNRTKQFTLEILETDLSKKTSDDYLITVMWNNGYYTDNGALKNKR
uniref:Uncharacterized protein n=1 Tax=Siphoviridae sp. ct8eQ1 TaxID=2826171 RepID=A0A8S5N046_9CAUD|nr:MAG TPA: hypothetical protein [Siphoviridae sp. ct8eQ1]